MESCAVKPVGIFCAPSHMVVEDLLVIVAFHFFCAVFSCVLYVSVSPSVTHGYDYFLSVLVILALFLLFIVHFFFGIPNFGAFFACFTYFPGYYGFFISTAISAFCDLIP